jgi:glycosyltransferase involved in cell wall biosynthesis
VTRVSVVIPTRDRLAGLERALASVDAQEWPELELLVADDGSTDGTSEWLAANRPEARRCPGAGGRGAGAARNRALALATGELIAFLDDDDRWRAGYLRAQVDHLAEHPDVGLGFTDHVEVDAQGREAAPDLRRLRSYPTPLVELLAEGGIHTMSTVVCRREVIEGCGGFDESLRVVQDLDWYARLLVAGVRMARVARPLVERSVPGALVADHRTWRAEERAVHARIAGVCRMPARHRRLVRAARALLFARIALARGDHAYGLARLAEALAVAPAATVRLAAVRLARNARAGRRAVPHAWSAAQPGAR